MQVQLFEARTQKELAQEVNAWLRDFHASNKPLMRSGEVFRRIVSTDCGCVPGDADCFSVWWASIWHE
jgi:hypothetical protein